MSDLLGILWVPFLMCLVLTGIHAYLGVHVLAREVVFVDIALAQIAALGATAAFLLGYETETWQSYAMGLAATSVGALVLALTRTRHRHVSQEAVIGVVYAVSSAGAVLLADRAAHGAEHVRTMLVGSLLSVGPAEVLKVALLYALVGLLHWLCRRPFFLISIDPAAAYAEGWRVRWWDFLFYASFGVVVTSSVRIAGVLLVFSYLIVPALAGIALGGTVATRLAIGWGFGTLVSVVGMAASALLDLPTGATVVCTFGLILLLFATAARLFGWSITGRASALSPPRSVARAAMTGRGTAMVALAIAAAAACATPGSSVFPSNLGSLAGTWTGWIDYGPGMTREITVVVEENGEFRGLDSRGQALVGTLRAVDGRLRWTSDVAGARGDARLLRERDTWVLRGRRDDGTLPFEWRRPTAQR